MDTRTISLLAVTMVSPRTQFIRLQVQRELNQASHGSESFRVPVRRLTQVRIPVTQEQSDQSFGNNSPAHSAESQRFVVTLAALGFRTLAPFELRFGKDVVPERRILRELLGIDRRQ